MARRRGGGAFGQAGMMRQLQELQENLLKAQEEIAEMTVTATAGGGAITVVVTGERRVQSISIEPEVIDPEDVEMLQDLIIAAVNQGMEEVEKASAEKMGALTGGMGLPPGLGLG